MMEDDSVENVDVSKFSKDLDDKKNESQVFLEKLEHEFFLYEILKMSIKILNKFEDLNLYEDIDHNQKTDQDTNRNQNVDQDDT